LYASGGTNFTAAFDEAIDIFANSTNVGTNTSGCQKAILFLTTSESDLNIDYVQSKSDEQGFKVFS
jgi:hypothetical protein